MDSREDTELPDETDATRADDHDETVTWNPDVRMGWLASDGLLSDGWFYAVRNRDGKTVTARDAQGLVNAMATADITSTLAEAFSSGPDPDLPEELR